MHETISNTMLRNVILGAATLATMAMSGAALAEGNATGSFAVTSEYVFRGIDSSQGAAVQGSLDYALDSGPYAGIWGSNTLDDTNEIDFYGGWSQDLTDTVSLDAGAIYYLFTEEDERFGPNSDTDYYEVYSGLGFSPFTNTEGVLSDVSTSVIGYYTTDYFSTSENAYYISGDVTVPISDSLALTGQVGFNQGDGVEAFLGDEYIDYSFNLTKSLDWADISFGVTGTNLDENDAAGFADSDAPKFVVTLSKGFGL